MQCGFEVCSSIPSCLVFDNGDDRGTCLCCVLVCKLASSPICNNWARTTVARMQLTWKKGYPFSIQLLRL